MLYLPLLLNESSEMKEKARLFHRLDKLFRINQSFFSVKFNYLLISKILAMNSYEFSLASNELCRCRKQQMPTSQFFEDFPALLYSVLTSDQFYYRDYSAIFDGSLLQCLQFAKKFYLLEEEVKAENLMVVIIRSSKVILPFAWNFVSKNERTEKALKILCALSTLKKWQFTPNEEFITNCVKEILPVHFLHLMSSFSGHDWNAQSSYYKFHALNSLSELMSLFISADLVKYLPKVSKYFTTLQLQH